MRKTENLVIIPLRGNSKRLPNKNCLEFNKVPLFMNSVNYAIQNSKYVSEIIISTECPTIKAIATKNKVRVLDRPQELSKDTTPTIAVLKHVVDTLDTHYENITLLQATNPLRPANLFKEAYTKFVNSNFESLITVTRNSQKFGKIKNHFFMPYNYKIGQRSQDLEPLYYENGLLYITKTALIKKGKLVGSKNYPFIVDHPYATVDIDEAFDLKYAEFILKNYPNE